MWELVQSCSCNQRHKCEPCLTVGTGTQKMIVFCGTLLSFPMQLHNVRELSYYCWKCSHMLSYMVCSLIWSAVTQAEIRHHKRHLKVNVLLSPHTGFSPLTSPPRGQPVPQHAPAQLDSDWLHQEKDKSRAQFYRLEREAELRVEEAERYHMTSGEAEK